MGRALEGARRAVRLAGPALLVWAVAEELRKPPGERTWTGKLAGFIPYDLRVPTLSRMQAAVWAPDDPRLFTPQAFGVGWSLNVGRVVADLRR